MDGHVRCDAMRVWNLTPTDQPFSLTWPLATGESGSCKESLEEMQKTNNCQLPASLKRKEKKNSTLLLELWVVAVLLLLPVLIWYFIMSTHIEDAWSGQSWKRGPTIQIMTAYYFDISSSSWIGESSFKHNWKFNVMMPLFSFCSHLLAARRRINNPRSNKRRTRLCTCCRAPAISYFIDRISTWTERNTKYRKT